MAVILAACEGAPSHTITWRFADHRSCSEANVTTVVVRSHARELTRVACSSDEAVLHDDDAPRVVEAESYAGTVLYRGHVASDETAVTLRYVGGSTE